MNQKKYKFHLHSFGRQHYATYASVKEMLIQNIQKSWDGGYDIATSLKDLIKLDLTGEEPSTSESNKTNDDKKAQEQVGFDIKYPVFHFQGFAAKY